MIWGSGLYRYLGDDEVQSVLSDIESHLEPIDSAKARRLATLLGVPSKPPEEEIHARPVVRKYPGGEGERHRLLKEAIFANPSLVGLSEYTVRRMEYAFRTGDRADVGVQDNNGTWWTIEVEIEGVGPCFTGTDQALKYRLLHALELKLSPNTTKVRATLAAYRIPRTVQTFCKRHGIEWQEVGLKFPDCRTRVCADRIWRPHIRRMLGSTPVSSANSLFETLCLPCIGLLIRWS